MRRGRLRHAAGPCSTPAACIADVHRPPRHHRPACSAPRGGMLGDTRRPARSCAVATFEPIGGVPETIGGVIASIRWAPTRCRPACSRAPTGLLGATRRARRRPRATWWAVSCGGAGSMGWRVGRGCVGVMRRPLAVWSASCGANGKRLGPRWEGKMASAGDLASGALESKTHDRARAQLNRLHRAVAVSSRKRATGNVKTCEPSWKKLAWIRTTRARLS